MSEPVNTNQQQEFQAKLLEMQAKFQEGLPERLDEIEKTWEQVICGKNIQDNLTLLHRLVHTLTGSAGTFCCDQLSKDSRALEVLLKGLVNENDVLTAEQVTQISSLLKAMEQASQAVDSNELLNNTLVPQLALSSETKILIVDDDETMAQMLSSQLVHFGYTVESVTQLSDVEKTLVEFRPSLIIADIIFPEGSLAGIEALDSYDFKDLTGFDIPVIFMSSRQDIEARLQAVRAGGDAYLCKPLNISLLLEKVNDLICSEDEEDYQILVIDDDKSLVDLITFVLERAGMQVQGITEPEQALDTISRQKPDLILMDVNMPWCNGIELAQVIRQQPSIASIPILFLSSETDEDLQFKAVLQGGDDFLTKPIDINRLSIFIKAKAQRARSLSALMIKDGLTGLYNHTYIKELIESEMSRLERNKSCFSVVMLDVDHFKQVNDTHGHSVGDQVLRSLSHFLSQRLRRADKIGRYGGEEFLVLLPDTAQDGALHLFRDILKGFSTVEHHDLNGKPFTVTFSAGVISSDAATTGSKLLELADKTLYKAKHAGRNQVLPTILD